MFVFGKVKLSKMWSLLSRYTPKLVGKIRHAYKQLKCKEDITEYPKSDVQVLLGCFRTRRPLSFSLFRLKKVIQTRDSVAAYSDDTYLYLQAILL